MMKSLLVNYLVLSFVAVGVVAGVIGWGLSIISLVMFVTRIGLVLNMP